MPPRKLISMSDNLVEAFNKLSRNPKAPSGTIANEWHFDIRYVPLEPCPSHVVAMINPGSRYFHLERVPLGVGQDDGAIAFFPESDKDAAPVVARALMFAFVNNMGNNRFMGRNAPPPYGPWNFTTEDRELAAAVGDELKRIGVRAPELCNVGVAKPDVIKIMQQHFNEIYKGLIASTGYTDIAAAALNTPDAIIFSNFRIANPPEIDSESQPKELQYVLQLTNSRPGTAGEVDAKAIGTKTMKEMARLEETLKNKPEAVVRREADDGNADAALDYGLRLLIGLQCTRDRTLAREYLVKAILAPNASDTIKTTAHGILIRWCLDAATDCIRSRYMLMASHHADQAAIFSRRAVPKGIAPASVLVFMQNDFERFAQKMPQLWLLFKNAMRAHDEREKQMQDGIEKMQQKRLEQPLRYRCAAVGCGIQADTGKMLQQCAGKCDVDKKPAYCSKACQKADWKNHKPFCVPGAECSVVDDGSYGDVSLASKKGAIQVPIHHADGSRTLLSSSTMDPQMLKEIRDFTEVKDQDTPPQGISSSVTMDLDCVD